MSLQTRVEPIDRDIAVILAEDLSPEARSRTLASFAQEALEDAQQINLRALDRVPDHETFVDGRANAPLESVRPDGRIVFEFNLLLDLFAWIGAELMQHSPVGGPPGPTYRENHLFFADGVQVPMGGVVPPAETYEYVNAVPYARKIERGLSPQAPDGVYQAVALLAGRRFGNVARIRFSYRVLAGSAKGDRQPAIIITLGR